MRLRHAPAPGSVADGITRGVVRLMSDLGYAPLTEFSLTNKRRVDVCALGRDGSFIVIEVKSSLTDYRTDGKWHEYLPYCDSFYFAVGTDFPKDVLPEDCGLIIADAYEAAIIRPSPTTAMNGNRRRTQTLRFGRTAASRLAGRGDPV
jgi:hypothetical protein